MKDFIATLLNVREVLKNMDDDRVGAIVKQHGRDILNTAIQLAAIFEKEYERDGKWEYNPDASESDESFVYKDDADDDIVDIVVAAFQVGQDTDAIGGGGDVLDILSHDESEEENG